MRGEWRIVLAVVPVVGQFEMLGDMGKGGGSPIDDARCIDPPVRTLIRKKEPAVTWIPNPSPAE